MRRIEVVNLDRWVSGFLRKNDYHYELDYFQRAKPLWEKAMTMVPNEPALPEGFYREEWERVIQNHPRRMKIQLPTKSLPTSTARPLSLSTPKLG